MVKKVKSPCAPGIGPCSWYRAVRRALFERNDPVETLAGARVEATEAVRTGQ
jgi:hypothetical protein